MLVLGLDIATSSGLTFLDDEAPPSSWRCFAIEAEGEFGEDKAGDLALALHDALGGRRPHFAAIEMPQRSVIQFEKVGGEGPSADTINPNALQLHDLAGAVCAVLDICGVPWGLIAPATWRSAYYGKGFSPPSHVARTKGGQPKLDRKGNPIIVKDWKQAAIDIADRQKILLPATLKARRDAAESVGIASAWPRCTLIPGRHQNAFKNLRLNYRRAA